jgi:hypothetical protein
MTAADNIRMVILPVAGGDKVCVPPPALELRERDWTVLRKPVAAVILRAAQPVKNYFSRNTCVRNVSRASQWCDTCRVLVHLPHDRAPFALHATENIFRMSAAHDRHLASALACADESR